MKVFSVLMIACVGVMSATAFAYNSYTICSRVVNNTVGNITLVASGGTMNVPGEPMQLSAASNGNISAVYTSTAASPILIKVANPKGNSSHSSSSAVNGVRVVSSGGDMKVVLSQTRGSTPNCDADTTITLS